MAANSSMGWRLMGGLAAILAGLAARKVLVTSWRVTTGANPPANPAQPGTRWRRRSRSPSPAEPRWAWRGCWRPGRRPATTRSRRVTCRPGWKRSPRPRAAGSSYSRGVLPALRDARGKPAGPLRALAVLVVLGMLVLAAPVLVPLMTWAAGLF